VGGEQHALATPPPQERDPVPIVHLLGMKEYKTKAAVFHSEASI